MTSIVKSLKRAVSSGRETDSQGSPHTLSQRRSASIPASPSFSDFSLSTHTDAECGYTPVRPEAATPPRSSFEDYLPASPQWLRNSTIFGGPPSPTAAMPIPQHTTATALQPTPSVPAQALPGRKEGKISGMDYYDYCELIRSSSL